MATIKFTVWFTFFCCFLSSTSYTQDKWFYSVITFGGPADVLLEVCEDTLINGNTYEILVSTQKYDHGLEFSHVSGYRRTIDNKVYFSYDKELESERLLYDFDLKPGEIYNSDIGTMTVTEVGTETIQGEELRSIKLENHDGSFEEIWVERIGSLTNGYLYPGWTDQIADGGSAFGCYYNGETKEWYTLGACDFSEFEAVCGDVLASDQNLVNHEFQVYPNPSSDYLHILVPNLASYCLQVIDTNGRIVIHQKRISGDRLINCASWPKGLYVVRISTKDQNWIEQLSVLR